MTDAAEPVVIPPETLSEEALAGVVEAFITREGTDYGESEYSLAEKAAQVRAQLYRGEVLILFDPVSASTTLVPRRELRAV